MLKKKVHIVYCLEEESVFCIRPAFACPEGHKSCPRVRGERKGDACVSMRLDRLKKKKFETPQDGKKMEWNGSKMKIYVITRS